MNISRELWQQIDPLFALKSPVPHDVMDRLAEMRPPQGLELTS